ncbi:general substrate transporter [Coniophora puteana RWD-64-598 SS2]|uniref:General substrate transporter n=1 Tax=Coniophora puteana (strain RWD-64-598) TaxID=741705 RepID=A0A5M3MZQ3_CONPW|nr:general substrate transporter [Coniophora puteana RWD-64-598 SS2]EIW84111.1 general substrate transporter [Coniophora puteana RWD-64-598 SS2]
MGLFFNTFVALFSAIGAFLYGYDSGIIASVKAMNQFNAHFHEPSNALLGAVVSTFNGGCFFGAAGAAWTNDKWGRKRTIQFGAVWALWGCAMQSGANNITTLLIGRIVAGVAIGILSMTVPLYNTEIAPSKRWLLEVGRDEEARQVVYKLHGGSTPESKEYADKEYAEMHDQIKADALIRSRRLSDLWATRPMLRRTLIAVGVQIFGQFTGINVINYFGPQMYQALGLTTSQSLLVQGIYGAVGPIANFFFITCILDSVGRKKPLMFGAASFVVTFSILAALVASFPPESDLNLSAQKAAISMIFLTSIIFSLSFGPVSWVLASEVFPTKTRSIGTSVATCANWLFNVLISETSPIGLANVGYKFYILFVCLNAVDFVIITLFFPETKGRTLEDMDIVFGDKVNAQQVLEEHVETKAEEIFEHNEIKSQA